MNTHKILVLVLAIVFVLVATATATAIMLTSSNGRDITMESSEALKADGVYAIIETNKGNIEVALFYKETPLTVFNFVGLAEGTLAVTKKKPFYNGLTFHRVIPNFMIQGGDPQGTGTGGPGYKFADEFVSSLRHDAPGVLSMANSGAGTNGSQFFITHVPTPWLDGKHTVFGRVVSGQDVVNKIAQGDKIVKITIIRNGAEAKKFTANQEDFDTYAKNVAGRAKEQNAAANKKIIEMIKEKWPQAKESETGVFFHISKEGKGEPAKKGATLTMKYKGFLLDGKIFDDSDMHEPLSFEVGLGKLIPGFDQQAGEMKVGEKRTIIIPPALAYGAQGAGGVIPPNAYIAFDLELLSIK